MWILYGLVCAFLHSLSDLYNRRIGSGVSTEVLVFIRFFYIGFILWLLVPFEGVPEFGPGLLRAYLIGIPIEILATLFYMRAIQLSPLSITAPLFASSPAFLLITEPIFMGEHSSLAGGTGILLIVLGAYMLHLKEVRKGFWAPIKSLGKEKGAIFMLGAAFLFSITANMGRLGVLNSSPAFFGASYFSILALLLLGPVLIRKRGKELLRKELILPGITIALSVFFHFRGVLLIQTGYFIAVKRVSLLFSIFMGIFLLKEQGGKERVLGGAVMMVGVVVILLFR